MILSKKQHEAIHQNLLMLFCFILPLHPRLSSLVIILCGLNWLVSGNLFKNFKSLSHPFPIIFISFYLLHILGLLYTSHWTDALQKIETKLPLILFPLILFTFPIKKNHIILSILKSFILGCFIASLFCTINALIKYIELGENWMYYKKLGSFLGFHPTYYSMYLSFALLTILFFLVKNFKILSKNKILARSLFIVWFLFFILLLSSRMTILATVIILGCSFLIWMYLNGKILKGIGFSFLGGILLLFLITNLPGLKERTKISKERIEQHSKKQGVSDPRINLWNAAFTVIKKYPLLGTGTGDIQIELSKVYKEKNFKKELEGNFNTHNQYLQTTVTLGLLGGCLLFVMLLLPLYLAIVQRDYLYLLFGALILFSFLTESILQTQRGTLFFGFFHSFFSMRLLLNKSHVLRKKKSDTFQHHSKLYF